MMQKEIYLAGGCFWGVEKYLSLIPGVKETEAGYANGKTAHPSYEDVCVRGTGHAETVKLLYDVEQLSLQRILDLFFTIIDPTAINRQGPDRGVQYRTGIYYTDPSDRTIIESALHTLQQRYTRPLAVECKPLENYYPAEGYHQKYLEKHPFGYCHIGREAFDQFRSASGLNCHESSHTRPLWASGEWAEEFDADPRNAAVQDRRFTSDTDHA